MRMFRWGTLLALLGAGVVPIASARAQQSDVIRGRVTGPDSQPIAQVVVTATSIGGNVSRTARTDRDGRFTIVFPGGEGDYMLSFAALGYAAKRFEVKRVADEDILLADARLQHVGGVLDAVEVLGERQRPRRNDVAPDASGTEQQVAENDVPANLLGDLAAMAATLPGVQTAENEDGSSGFSVFGLGADQNNVTLNGMSFGGMSLPRDAAVMTSLVTSPYDVSRGGFSGGQLSLRTRSGSNFIARTGSFNLDAPGLQWTDAAARALGREYTNASLGGLLSGPIVYDKAFYNLSYQLGRRSSDAPSLLATGPLGLQAAGVAPDSAARLMSILASQQVPATLPSIGDDRLGDSGLIFGSVDFTSPSSTSGTAVNLAFNGSWSKQRTPGGQPTETPAFGGDRTNWRAGVQGSHSTYFGVGILSETSLGVSASKTFGTPYLRLPAGQVQVASQFDDGSVPVEVLGFGGNPAMASEQTSASVEAHNQLSWFSRNNKHRLKLTTELQHDQSGQRIENNTLGTFSYASLAALEANTPSFFTRQLAPRRRDVGQVSGSISLGDSYRPASNFQLTYGLRLDGARFLDTPQANPALDTLFGLRNAHIPERLYVSPRAGFSWTYGTAPQIASFFGAQRGPRAVVRGGVGVFQQVPRTSLIGSAIDNTGLPSGVQQITCAGSATPVPDWGAYAANPAAIPSTCADGSLGTPFANLAPNVIAFADDYVSPRSVRSNVNWSGPVLNNRFAASLDLTWSVNLNQSSFVDRNFDPSSGFTLSEEGDRPVFVQPSSIVPATGAIASQDARHTSRYARVTELRSDLRSRSAQATVRLSPTRFSSAFSWSAWYTYTDVREQVRGFTSTAGDPLAVSWSASSFSPHSIGYRLGYNFFDFLRVNWFGQFRSGMRYTPMVANDVNGDGYANDRAFVFDPASAADPQVAAGMDALLSRGSSSARACLSAQRGTLAARNSCTGPWTSTATMSFSFNPLKVHMPQRANISFQLSNPLGAADLLLHGSGGLRGWGQTPFPDQSLLYVTGFDAANKRYTYAVNERFGATNPALTQFRAPVTLTAIVRIDLGPTRERQLLTQQLDRGRRRDGDRVPEVLLRAMFSNGGIPNPLATILRDQDTLRLSSTQADSIASMNRRYVIALDRIWSPIVKEFSELPDDYDQDAVYHRYLVARRTTVDLLKQLAPVVKGLLDDEQFRRLPTFVASYLDTRYLASIRSGTAGIGAGGGMFGGFIPAGADVTAVGNGVRIRVRVP